MRCIGITNDFKRCKNKTKGIVCKKHRKQLVIFVAITFPSVVLTYFGVFQAFIRPVIVQKEIPSFLIKVEESVVESKPEWETSYWPDDSFSESATYLVDPRNIDSVLFAITDKYNRKEKEKAIELIESYFDTNIDSNDKYLGYIVASYFYSQRFDKAAEIVLERNKSRKRWDYSLKLDYAKCIRYYTVSNTLNEGIELVQNHLVKYKSPIISYFWTSIPFEIMSKIELGLHSHSDIKSFISSPKIKNIAYLVNHYPDDKFIQYGYYVSGNYKKSVEFKDSRIIDVCLYAYGYDITKSIYSKYKTYDHGSLYDLIPEKPIQDLSDINSITSGIKAFKDYVALSDSNAHSDDASFWIAWLNTFLGNYDKTYDWLLKCQQIGNNDYNEICLRYFYKFNEQISVDEATVKAAYKQNVKIITSNKKDRTYSDIHKVHSLFDQLESSEIETLCVDNDSFDYTYSYVYRLYDQGLTDKAISLYHFLEKADSNFTSKMDSSYQSWIDELIEIKRENVQFTDFIRYVLHVKNNITSGALTLHLIQIGLQRYAEDSNAIEYLKYLRVRTLVFFDPSKVEFDVMSFIKKHPKSEYCDDVLAELIQVQFLTLWEPEKAFENLDLLFRRFPNSNACDNALNTLGKFYEEYCNPYYGDWEKNCLLSIDVNNLIIRNYPGSSYYSNAIQRRKRSRQMLMKVGN